MKARAALIAVDGVNGPAVDAAAQRIVQAGRRAIKGVSRFDASGLFEQMLVAENDAGAASPRTLLLLYAADLAFRLRWEIEPALNEGQSVVAAPYVETPVAFGRACGLSLKWLHNLFRFARRPSERHTCDAPPGKAGLPIAGFVEFGCAQLVQTRGPQSERKLGALTRAHLRDRGLRARRSVRRAG
jgi:thymidylate kinase